MDEDCSGSYDDLDADGDGHISVSCTVNGLVSGDDCNDSNPMVSPSVVETDNLCDDGIDQDCSGAELLCTDVDNDGDGEAETDGDCDDNNPNVHSNGVEICDDGIDQDCDLADQTCDDVDDDGDGQSENAGDCDDTDPLRFLGNTENTAAKCGNGFDDDCDGNVDSLDSDCSGVDADGDGFALSHDCDDTDATINPLATEDASNCGNGVDEDCSGADLSCLDVDNDLDGQSENEGDCDDTNGGVNSSATEVCADGFDNNCNGDADLNDVTCIGQTDQDGDGVIGDFDCDDGDATAYPGATEICGNAIDEDCSGVLDDLDADQDGHYDAACPGGDDCDDSNPMISPTVVETDNLCDDGIDQDCSGADLLCTEVDNDGDGETEAAGDCDDTNSSIHSNGAEVCGDGVDQDCDGADLLCSNVDSDGDGVTPTGGDCDDTDANRFPGNTENTPDKCFNGFDDDCDGIVDALDTDCLRVDGDSDGYSAMVDCNDNDSTINPGATESAADCDNGVDEDCSGADLSCLDVDNDNDGQSENDGDCDDSNSAVLLGGTEICGDGQDNNCDGLTDLNDPNCGSSVDSDGDGFSGIMDCDEANPAINAGAVELCGNAIDEDCSGNYDDLDFDGDGRFSDACTVNGTVPGTDCDDSDAMVSPAAVETDNLCDDGIDQDCSGTDLSCLDVDNDGDGQAESAGDCDDTNSLILTGGAEVCGDGVDQDCLNGDLDCDDVDDDGDGFSENAGDCDDTTMARSPGNTEDTAALCGDGIDNDCNGSIDEIDLDCQSVDSDGDGFAVSHDCNDTDATVNPLATEDTALLCGDGLDNDCSGAADVSDGNCSDYYDVDNDGYCADVVSCSDGSLAGDCDESSVSLNPGQFENSEALCSDTLDNDCDGNIDIADGDCAGQVDSDNDGWTVAQGDCDDGTTAINPAAAEVCDDATDTDCDGDATATEADCNYLDKDGDGASTLIDCDDNDATVSPLLSEGAADCDDGIDQDCVGGDLSCLDVDNDGDGVSENAGDCNDADSGINPSAAENCLDSLDNDCDTFTDLNDSDCTVLIDQDGDGYTGVADCNDSDPAISPGATEICGNAVDEDCSGTLDDLDADSDTHYALGCTVAGVPGDDCADSSAAVSPSVTETDNLCGDLIDQDCSGSDLSCNDVDNDGDGETVNGGDCDDNNDQIHTGGAEICGDGLDQDCLGGDLACTAADNDGDGFTVALGDCDDFNANRYPTNPEVCTDGVDNDCDGFADTFDSDCPAYDGDGDGYSTAADCDDTDATLNLDDLDGDGVDTCGGDCDDARPNVFPGAQEACEPGLDLDCDGTDSGVDADSNCLGTLTCTDVGGGMIQVVINGTISTSTGVPEANIDFLEVGSDYNFGSCWASGADCGQLAVAAPIDGVDNTLTFNMADFSPRVQSNVGAEVYFNLNNWDTAGDGSCSIILDSVNQSLIVDTP
ncbi:MopE-related protein [Patescibacteria group bacterium]